MGVLEIEEGTEESFRSVPVMVSVTMRCERLLCWWMSVAPSALRSMPTLTSWMTSPGQWAGLGGGGQRDEGLSKDAMILLNIGQGSHFSLFTYVSMYRPGRKGGDVILSLRPQRNIVPQLTLHAQERETRKRHTSV